MQLADRTESRLADALLQKPENCPLCVVGGRYLWRAYAKWTIVDRPFDDTTAGRCEARLYIVKSDPLEDILCSIVYAVFGLASSFSPRASMTRRTMSN